MVTGDWDFWPCFPVTKPTCCKLLSSQGITPVAMVTQLGSSPFHRVTLPGAWSLSLPLLFGASYQEKKRLSTFNTKFTCYSLSVIFFLLIRSKKYLVLKRNLLLSCHFYLPLPSLLGSVKRMSPTFWKKKSKNRKKNSIVLLLLFSFFKSCKNCFSPFSSEKWLGRDFS